MREIKFNTTAGSVLMAQLEKQRRASTTSEPTKNAMTTVYSTMVEMMEMMI